MIERKSLKSMNEGGKSCVGGGQCEERMKGVSEGEMQGDWGGKQRQREAGRDTQKVGGKDGEIEGERGMVVEGKGKKKGRNTKIQRKLGGSV